MAAVIALIGFIVWWFFGQHTTATAAAKVSTSGQNARVVVNGGYAPETIVLKKGVPVKLTFHRQDSSTCLDHVVFLDMGINDFLPKDQDHTTMVNTSKAGELEFACGMNMFHGKLIIK